MTQSERPDGPLRDVRVVELAAVGPAPFCTMLLADMGAQILRVSPPAHRPSAFPFAAREDPMCRGRSWLTLDLKEPPERARFLEILPYCHVLIEGFRPGVLERLGIGPEVCLSSNPHLVIGRMTGWGQTGPLAHAPGHDPNYLALTGALHSIGPANAAPCPPLNLVGDMGGGAMYLAVGVLAALLHVRSGGAGQVVDAAMVDGATSLMTMIYALRSHRLWSDERGSNLLDGGCPYGTTYETADGRYIVVCALEPQFYRALLTGLGLDERDLPRREDRSAWPLLRRKFASVFKTKTREEWARLLEGTDACVTPVLDMGEAPHHPHNLARGIFAGDPPTPGPAPRFSSTRTTQAPAEGPNVVELLESWGMPSDAARAAGGG